MDIARAGEKIRELRTKLELSQKQLAAKSGVAYATIQQIESGEGNPTLGTIQSLADTLKVEALELFSENRSPRDIAHLVAEMREATAFLSKYVNAPRDIQFLVLALISKDPSHLRSSSANFRRLAIAFLKAILDS